MHVCIFLQQAKESKEEREATKRYVNVFWHSYSTRVNKYIHVHYTVVLINIVLTVTHTCTKVSGKKMYVLVHWSGCAVATATQGRNTSF